MWPTYVTFFISLRFACNGFAQKFDNLIVCVWRHAASKAAENMVVRGCKQCRRRIFSPTTNPQVIKNLSFPLIEPDYSADEKLCPLFFGDEKKPLFFWVGVGGVWKLCSENYKNVFFSDVGVGWGPYHAFFCVFSRIWAGGMFSRIFREIYHEVKHFKYKCAPASIISPKKP